MIDKNRLLDKIRGGLYGQALGDAFCMPAYFTQAQTVARFGDQPITALHAAHDDHPVHHGLRAGQFTDDTEQAFALAAAIITDGRMTIEGAGRAITNWYDQIDGDNSPYVGPSTRRGVQQLRNGADPYTAGARGDTNGSGMRVSVIGLINPGAVDHAIEEAVFSAIPTHGTDVGISGACAIAAAVACAFSADTIDKIVTAGIYGAEAGQRYGQPWLAASVPRRIRAAVAIARQDESEQARLRELYDLIGTGLAITEAVPSAFAVLVMAGGDPVRAAQIAFKLSGDADTIGAMACAIAGTWRGIDAIPRGFQQTLRGANPAHDFEATAGALHKLALKRVNEHV